MIIARSGLSTGAVYRYFKGKDELIRAVVTAAASEIGAAAVLPGTDVAVLVSRMRLGQGGLIFRGTAASGDPPGEQERPVKLTTEGSPAQTLPGYGR